MRGSAGIAVAATALLVSGCTLNRPEDPVVLKGAEVSALADVAAGDVVAFRWVNAWDQVPVQVDERKLVDIVDFADPSVHATLPFYTDPNTFVGADQDPDVDADDEVAFMAKDVGLQAPSDARDPTGVVAGSGVKVKVRSTLGGTGREGWVYLFERSGSSLSPGAGESYVDYDFKPLTSETEDSTVTTPYYSAHFPARWINDERRVKTGNASAVDILDREKIQFYPGECSTNEGRFFGQVLGNRSGPVRGIRSILTAASGHLTERNHIFYEQREDVVTHLRVHPIPGIMDFFDYSAAASGMKYRNNNNPSGVTIDGNPDNVAAGPLTWETVDGPQGGLSMVHTVTTDVPNVNLSSYYLDDSTPDAPTELQCTGDSAAMGSSGPMTGPLDTTDPNYPPAYSFTHVRTIYFEAPGKADGPARHAQATSPFQITVSPSP